MTPTWRAALGVFFGSPQDACSWGTLAAKKSERPLQDAPQALYRLRPVDAMALQEIMTLKGGNNLRASEAQR